MKPFASHYAPNISLTIACALLLIVLSASCYAAPNPSVVEACKLLDETQQYARSYQLQDGRGHVIDPYLPLQVHHCLENIPYGKVRSEIISAAEDYLDAGRVADYAGDPAYRSGTDIIPPRSVFDIFSKYRVAQETSYDGKAGLKPQDLFDVDSRGRLTKEGVALTQKVLGIIWRSASLHTEKAEILEGVLSSETVYGSVQEQFLRAIDHNETENLQTWLKKGASLNQMDRHGDTPVIQAFSSGHLEVVNQLLKAGATFDHTQATQALILISGSGYITMTQLLILKGANVNAKDKDFGNSVLEIAVQGGQLETAKLLLSAGADINAKNNLDETALWAAAENDLPEMVQFLLTHHADATIKDEDGKTPLAIAEEKDLEDIAVLLEPAATDSSEQSSN